MNALLQFMLNECKEISIQYIKQIYEYETIIFTFKSDVYLP